MVVREKGRKYSDFKTPLTMELTSLKFMMLVGGE